MVFKEVEFYSLVFYRGRIYCYKWSCLSVSMVNDNSFLFATQCPWSYCYIMLSYVSNCNDQESSFSTWWVKESSFSCKIKTYRVKASFHHRHGEQKGDTTGVY